MKSYFLTGVIAIAAIFSGCQTDTQQEGGTSFPGVDLPQEQVEIYDDFSVVINGQQVLLQQWESELNFQELLGEPQSESTQELPPTADTHAGAMLKFAQYPGLIIQSYAPPGTNADGDFWIMNMTVTSGDFTTGRGIKIGDERDAVTSAYPEMIINTARAGEIFVLESLGEPMTLYIVVQNNRVSEIELMYQLP